MMKKHFKWAGMLLLAASLVGMTACGSKESKAEKNGTETAETSKAQESTAEERAEYEGSAAAVYYEDAWYEPKENLETLLFLGIDKYADNPEQKGYVNNEQSDFNLVVVIDKDAGEMHFLQLNRDTMCEIQVLGTLDGSVAAKVTAQLALAHTYGSGGSDSCINAKTAVSDLLYGMKIDHYAALTMDGVAIINDALGGITVSSMDDITLAGKEYHKGDTVTLTGEMALTYVRARSELSDSTNIHRMERQRQYMSAFLQQFFQMGGEDEEFLVSLNMKLGDCLQTDLSANQMQKLFEATKDLSVDEIVTPDGESVVGDPYMEFYVDEEALQKLVIELFYDKVT